MDGNTATLLNLVAKGARDHGAEVQFYTLFKMKFMACQSCFSCRMQRRLRHQRRADARRCRR